MDSHHPCNIFFHFIRKVVFVCLFMLEKVNKTKDE